MPKYGREGRFEVLKPSLAILSVDQDLVGKPRFPLSLSPLPTSLYIRLFPFTFLLHSAHVK